MAITQWIPYAFNNSSCVNGAKSPPAYHLPYVACFMHPAGANKMTVSAAKVEANRRNAQKSTGPRTDVGKLKSSKNAITHGLRAKMLVLPEEDPQVLEDRRAAWRACLAPRDEIELSIVDDAVESSWMQDRARRAQAARLASNIASAGGDQARREADEVLRLGQRLFADSRGPLADYPHGDAGIGGSMRRLSHSDLLDDPQDPPRLVLHLQATAGGCQWMLDQWADLRSILADGLNWQSVDKLKAVRLMGRHPMEAVDDRNVLLVFIACQRMEGRPIDTIPEIWRELRPGENDRYTERIRGRGSDRLVPNDPAAARQVLFDLIDQATAQLKIKAEEHHRRAEVVYALAAECLLFDDSPEGERLRRYELANGRAKARSLNELRIRQRSPLPVVRGQLQFVCGELSVASRSAEVLTEAIAPNEPTAHRDIAPNEPTNTPETAPNEPTATSGIAPNEPTDTPENVTNEPTATSGIAPAALTVAQKKASKDVEVAVDCENGDWIDPAPGADDADAGEAESRSFDKEPGASMIQALVNRKSMRMHELVELAEGRRKEVERLMAERRARRAHQRQRNCKTAEHAKGRAASGERISR
jgi:hypothetical protein